MKPAHITKRTRRAQQRSMRQKEKPRLTVAMIRECEKQLRASKPKPGTLVHFFENGVHYSVQF